MPSDPGARHHVAGLSVEQRLAALEESLRMAPKPGAAPSNGCVTTSDTTQTGGVRWENHGIVDTLPGSPVDGQECTYQNAVMATAGVVWRFKYRAARASYKWEFIGGCALPCANPVATQQGSTGSYGALATAGPTVVVPLAGDYHVTTEAEIFNASGVVGFMSYDIGGTGAVDVDAITGYIASSAGQSSCSRTKRKFISADATTLTTKYKGVGCFFAHRNIQITPIYVGTA